VWSAQRASASRGRSKPAAPSECLVEWRLGSKRRAPAGQGRDGSPSSFQLSEGHSRLVGFCERWFGVSWVVSHEKLAANFAAPSNLPWIEQCWKPYPHVNKAGHNRRLGAMISPPQFNPRVGPDTGQSPCRGQRVCPKIRFVRCHTPMAIFHSAMLRRSRARARAGSLLPRSSGTIPFTVIHASQLRGA
jgi:hypothetical protein